MGPTARARTGSEARGASAGAGLRAIAAAASSVGRCGAFDGSVGRRSRRRSLDEAAGFTAGGAAAAGGAEPERVGSMRTVGGGGVEPSARGLAGRGGEDWLLAGSISGGGAGRLATALCATGAEGGLGSARGGAAGGPGSLAIAGLGAGAGRDDSAVSGLSRSRVSTAAGFAAGSRGVAGAAGDTDAGRRGERRSNARRIKLGFRATTGAVGSRAGADAGSAFGRGAACRTTARAAVGRSCRGLRTSFSGCAC